MDATLALETIRLLAARQAGLGMLVLFGSRARGDAAATSDWDFAYLADDTFDPASFLGVIVAAVGTEHVDLVDLRTATGLLRFRAARDGRLVAGDEDLMNRFRLEAATFWCDSEPVLRSAYGAVLARL
jgi:predicted nucleotidyltransferase